MGQYWVDEPVTFLEGNKVRVFKRPTTGPVKIDDAAASKLGGAVRKVGGESPESEPKVDEKPNRNPTQKQADKQ